MVLALGVIGVLAVQSLDLQIGGSINFTAEGVNATIKLVETAGLTGADGKFQDVTITRKKQVNKCQQSLVQHGVDLN